MCLTTLILVLPSGNDYIFEMSWIPGIYSLLIILSAVSPCSIFMFRSDCDETLCALVFERRFCDSSVLLLSPDFLKECGREVSSM